MTENGLTVGVITPHAAPGPEVELPAMSSGRLATVVSRTGSPSAPSHTSSRTAAPARSELRTSTEFAAIDRAAFTFGDQTLAAVAHASTTTGYLIGYQDEAATVERLSHRFGVPAVATCAATVAALRTHEVGRIQLVHPPWFDDQLDELGAVYFRGQAFDTVVTKAVDLSSDPARVEYQHVVEWVEHHLDDRAEAVVLAGTGFRAAGAIQEVELRTDRLVVEANQALLWRILAVTDTDWTITGYGRLLRTKASTT